MQYPGGADRIVEPRIHAHFEDRGHAAPWLADQHAVRIVKLDLARRVRTISELVLESLQAERVERAVRQHARHEEARESARGLRQDEKAVAHRRRKEPLV